MPKSSSNGRSWSWKCIGEKSSIPLFHYWWTFWKLKEERAIDHSVCITNRIYNRQKYKVQKKKVSKVQKHKSQILNYWIFCVAMFCTESGSDEKTYLAFWGSKYNWKCFEIKWKQYLWWSRSNENKLAKARKTRKLPGTLGSKKFGPGKLWVEKVWPKIFLLIFSLNF